MKLNRFMVVLSAYRADRSEHENERSMFNLEDQISSESRRFQYDKAQGVYKGEHEPALAVQCSDFTDVGMLLQWAREYSQESILLVDARGKAFLLYCEDSRLEPLGNIYTHHVKEYGEPAQVPNSYTVMNGIMYYTV